MKFWLLGRSGLLFTNLILQRANLLAQTPKLFSRQTTFKKSNFLTNKSDVKLPNLITLQNRNVNTENTHCNKENSRQSDFFIEQIRGNLFTWFCGFLGIIALSTQTIFSEYLLSKFFLWKQPDGKPLKLSMKTMELINDIIQSSQIDDFHKQVNSLYFYLSNNIEPIILSDFHLRFGVKMVLPFYFDYESTDQIDEWMVCKMLKLDHDRLVKTRLEDGRPLMEHLKKSLVLSNDAKWFILTTLVHRCTFPTTFVNSMSVMLIPFLTYSAANFIKERFRINNPILKLSSVILGFALAGANINYFKTLQKRYGTWAIFKYEINEKTLSTDGFENEVENENDLDKDNLREKYLRGAEEYLQKLNHLESIIYKFSSFNDNCPMKSNQSNNDHMTMVTRLNELSKNNNLEWSDLF